MPVIPEIPTFDSKYVSLMITAYDHPSAVIADRAGADIILGGSGGSDLYEGDVGDTIAGHAGMDIILGDNEYDTKSVELEEQCFSLIALQKKIVASRKALKQYDQAIKIYLNVIDIYSGYNNPAGTVATMEDLAELYLEIGERQKSADTYRTIASIHKNFKHSLQAKEYTDKAAQVEQAN